MTLQLCGYTIRERAAQLWQDATQKWANKISSVVHPSNFPVHPIENLMKFTPSEIIQLANLYSKLCPECKNMKCRLIPQHLKIHDITAPEILVEVRQVNEQVEHEKKISRKEKKLFDRVKTIRKYGELYDHTIFVIKNFLNERI